MRASFNNYKNFDQLVGNGRLVEGFMRHAFDALGFPQPNYKYSELVELAEMSQDFARKWGTVQRYRLGTVERVLDKFYKIDRAVDLSTPTTPCRVGVDFVCAGTPTKRKQNEIIDLHKEFGGLVVDHHIILVATLPRFGGWGGYPKEEKEEVLLKLEDILYAAAEAAPGEEFFIQI